MHLDYDYCDLCTNYQPEGTIIDLDEEDEDFIDKNDLWSNINDCPGSEEDVQSNDGSIIIITMAELMEESRRIGAESKTSSSRKCVAPTLRPDSEPIRTENGLNLEENGWNLDQKFEFTNTGDDVASIA